MLVGASSHSADDGPTLVGRPESDQRISNPRIISAFERCLVTNRRLDIQNLPIAPVASRALKWLVPLLAIGAIVSLDGQSGELRLTPGEVSWPAAAAGGVGTSGVSGIQTVVLKGDPAKPGLYTLLLRVGPNTRIEAHAHPDDRVATVISGTWYFGYGTQFGEAALKALPPGSMYTEPPNANHFAMTRGEGVVIQITGVGPSGTTYVDPNDDPARRR
jgi:quercetin dioxygenase-like cupin family protein